MGQMSEFKTKIQSRDIDIEYSKPIVNHKDFDLSASDFEIDFNIDIEYRDWGIKGISIYATKINGSIFLNDMDSGEEEEIICNDFEIENEVESDKIPFTIEGLRIDLDDKKIFVN